MSGWRNCHWQLVVIGSLDNVFALKVQVALTIKFHSLPDNSFVNALDAYLAYIVDLCGKGTSRDFYVSEGGRYEVRSHLCRSERSLDVFSIFSELNFGLSGAVWWSCNACKGVKVMYKVNGMEVIGNFEVNGIKWVLHILNS